MNLDGSTKLLFVGAGAIIAYALLGPAGVILLGAVLMIKGI